jgi:hypothetical protein
VICEFLPTGFCGAWAPQCAGNNICGRLLTTLLNFVLVGSEYPINYSAVVGVVITVCGWLR